MKLSFICTYSSTPLTCYCSCYLFALHSFVRAKKILYNTKIVHGLKYYFSFSENKRRKKTASNQIPLLTEIRVYTRKSNRRAKKKRKKTSRRKTADCCHLCRYLCTKYMGKTAPHRHLRFGHRLAHTGNINFGIA